MAEDESGQEKSEDPTGRRIEKAREEGQIPRSKELSTSAVLLGGALGLMLFGHFLGESLSRIMKNNFSFSREVAFDPNFMLAHLTNAAQDVIFALMPLMGVLVLMAILGPIGLGGWLFSTKAMAPKLNRMDPIAGLKRMFSLKSLMELLKSILKVSVIAAMGTSLLMWLRQDFYELSRMATEPAIERAITLTLWVVMGYALSTLLIAIVDVPFQIYDNKKNLRMTKQQVKDEMKDTDGKPEVKGRIRQLQREMANKRMMQSVPDADVVITNPTHYSVALKYDPDNMETPILLAKGVDEVALRIREVAKENNVEMVQAPVLARAVYNTTEVESEIPAGLYMAVAQVLAYVFQLRSYRAGQGERPTYPRNLNVPRDLQFD